MGTIFSFMTLEEMYARDRAIVALIKGTPMPHRAPARVSPIGMTVPEFFAALAREDDKPTHICGCGWRGTASGDAGACPACGGVPTPQG